jgi:hypothetical protein
VSGIHAMRPIFPRRDRTLLGLPRRKALGRLAGL